MGEIRHLLALEAAKEMTVKEHYEARQYFCFAIGCLTRYYDGKLVDGSKLEMEGIEFDKPYIEELIARPGVDSNPAAVTNTEATLIVLYLLHLESQLTEPVADPEPAAEEPVTE